MIFAINWVLAVVTVSFCVYAIRMCWSLLPHGLFSIRQRKEPRDLAKEHLYGASPAPEFGLGQAEAFAARINDVQKAAESVTCSFAGTGTSVEEFRNTWNALIEGAGKLPILDVHEFSFDRSTAFMHSAVKVAFNDSVNEINNAATKEAVDAALLAIDKKFIKSLQPTSVFAHRPASIVEIKPEPRGPIPIPHNGRRKLII